MIKGHTRIELTDVETGEVEVHEDDNLFTNAFKRTFANALGNTSPTNRYSNYSYNQPYLYGYLNLFPYKLFGGLLAFENSIEEDADNTMYPLTNKIIARGSDFAYTGEELELGSMAVSETGFQEDGSYKIEWNFDTAHGNGQISSVCLTSPFGGRLGTGCSTTDTAAPTTNSEDDKNALSDKTVRKPNSYEGGRYPDFYSAYCAEQNERLGNSQYYYMTDACQMLYVNGDKDEMLILSRGRYCFTKDSTYSGSEFIKDSGKLRINKFRYPNKKISIFDGCLMKYLGDETIELPDAIKTQINQNTSTIIYGGIWSDYGYIYMLLYPSNTIAQNAQFYILKIDVSDYSASVITLINTYSRSITLSTVYDGARALQYVCGNNDYFVFYDNTGKRIVKMLLSDSTQIAILKSNGDEYEAEGTYFEKDETNLYLYSTSGKNICINTYDEGNEAKNMHTSLNNIRLCRINAAGYYIPIYEKIGNRNVCIRHAYVERNDNLSSAFCTPETYDTKFKALNTRGNSTACMISDANPRLLYTINNLSSPVTKTAAQTMKITYTLTEVDETT